MHSDRGDILTSGLLKLLLFLAVLALIVFEAGAVMVNQVQADEAAGGAARAALAASASSRAQPHLEEAARAALPERTTLDALTADAEGVEVTVTRQANVVVLDRIGPLEGLASATVSRRADRR